ncbi:MAG: hypothetical protein LBD59_04965 [Prevotellaceae bacterium]|nr:hypothetical protein [Prevotellaceae bacterium]
MISVCPKSQNTHQPSRQGRNLGRKQASRRDQSFRQGRNVGRKQASRQR